MFSIQEKRKISEAVEKVLLELGHPEMPLDKPLFILKVQGKEEWSYATILPNWSVTGDGANTWNEVARDILRDQDDS